MGSILDANEVLTEVGRPLSHHAEGVDFFLGFWFSDSHLEFVFIGLGCRGYIGIMLRAIAWSSGGQEADGRDDKPGPRDA